MCVGQAKKKVRAKKKIPLLVHGISQANTLVLEIQAKTSEQNINKPVFLNLLNMGLSYEL